MKIQISTNKVPFPFQGETTEKKKPKGKYIDDFQKKTFSRTNGPISNKPSIK